MESIVSLSDAVKHLSELVGNCPANLFDDGLAWYAKAHTECVVASREVGVNFSDFCKVVAVLSPLTQWERNIEAAISLCKQFKAGVTVENMLPTGTRFYRNAKKAHAILSGEVFTQVGATKTYSFYRNLFNPSEVEYLTVDFHMLNAAMGKRNTWEQYKNKVAVNPATYQTIASAVREVARQYNILPLQAQAIIWLAVKELYK